MGKRTMPGIGVPSGHTVSPLGVPSTPSTSNTDGVMSRTRATRFWVLKPNWALEGVTVSVVGVTIVVTHGVASASVSTLTAFPFPSAKYTWSLPLATVPAELISCGKSRPVLQYSRISLVAGSSRPISSEAVSANHRNPPASNSTPSGRLNPGVWKPPLGTSQRVISLLAGLTRTI